MILREFVDVLHNSKRFGTNKSSIVKNLFSAAGCYALPSESAVKSWLKPNSDRNCQISRYFRDNSINETKFVNHFRRSTPSDVWRILQDLFREFKLHTPDDFEFCIDLATENAVIFYWSVLNQFQRILHIPETERREENVNSACSNASMSLRAHDYFMDSVNCYQIMDIINRTPPVLNRYDAGSIHLFLDKLDGLLAHKEEIELTLYSLINSFVGHLRVQGLRLDTELIGMYDMEDDKAIVNMDDKDSSYECDTVTNRSGMYNTDNPDELNELLSVVEDPIGLLGTILKGWKDFQYSMNRLYKEISEWQQRSFS